MKFITALAFLTLISLPSGHAQTNPQNSPVDTALAKAITVAGVCLCQTSIPDLQKSCPDLKGINVEEMDLPKECFGRDPHFENGKGYYSDKYPGIIFQKDPDTNYISKIRLTKTFNGNLPNGASVSVQDLTPDKVFQIYPELKGKWGSRDCSGYWNISNDTISFFVKIDPDRKPKYPVDEAYYSQKPIEAIDIKFSCLRFSQIGKDIKKTISSDPLFFIDSIHVEKPKLMTLKPEEVADITVLKGESATRLLGPKAIGGAVFIETKRFARIRYWNFFKMKSLEYAKVVPDPESDSSVVYILNGKVLKNGSEGDLAGMNNETFIDLKIIDKNNLAKNYGVIDKTYGVLISANIVNKKSKIQSKN